MGYNQQALYCYRKVYSLDPANVHALWERAVLARNIGEFRTVAIGHFPIVAPFFILLYRRAMPFWPF